jgi:hypothetical protein
MFTPSAIAGTVAEFVSLIEPEVPAIASMAGVNPTVVAQVSAGLDGLKQSSAALAQADSAAAASPVAQRVIADGQALLAVLASLPLPPQAVWPVRIAGIVFGMLPGIVAMLFPSAAVTADTGAVKVGGGAINF